MTRETNPYEKPHLRTTAIVAAIVLIILGALSSFNGLNFHPVNGDDALIVLGRLILIALFVERGIEVFAELWRGSLKNKKKHELEEIKKECAYDGKNFTEKQSTLNTENIRKVAEDLFNYQTITMRITLWMGFLFGLLVSVSGVRALGTLIEAPVEGAQLMLFQGVDIILTASLISGGSEGIHKIMTVFKRFMEESESRLKQGRRNLTDQEE